MGVLVGEFGAGGRHRGGGGGWHGGERGEGEEGGERSDEVKVHGWDLVGRVIGGRGMEKARLAALLIFAEGDELVGEGEFAGGGGNSGEFDEDGVVFAAVDAAGVVEGDAEAEAAAVEGDGLAEGRGFGEGTEVGAVGGGEGEGGGVGFAGFGGAGLRGTKGIISQASATWPRRGFLTQRLRRSL